MEDGTRFVGMDVSRKQIAVAVAEGSGGVPYTVGTIANLPEAVKKLVRQLEVEGEPLLSCYEAGPTGYWLQRELQALGAYCVVVAPSLTPRKPGDRVKTDRRDALKLARLLRSGELTPCHVPGEEEEGLREVSRTREWAMQECTRAKDRLGKLLLRWGIEEPTGMKKRWTRQYWGWLERLRPSSVNRQTVLTEHVLAVRQAEERLRRAEQALEEAAEGSRHRGLIEGLQVLRGVKLVTAASLVAELGDFSRFGSPRELMAYVGLVPSESSSGERQRRGRITRAGSYRLRRLATEVAWHQRHPARLSKELVRRQQGQPEVLKAMSWEAQQRLSRRFRRLLARGKARNVAAVAVAREFFGFAWALAGIYRSLQEEAA